ncbi:hypothetical protein JZ751_000308 [Albula glossodonta]|uniref:RRM domain-containing protein n=1 Tax=Albula glossodonta TaxID=121402 RepID=A0A8T2PVS3_9TELE|nr:hypothetical protein JZ751_000308 [Albula glossodonta]
MSEECLEERTVEVSDIPEEIEDELLALYFENKRRSGGGPLVSFHRKGSCAVLVFEATTVAARVLAKETHVLQGSSLTVRRQAPKDPGKLLLRGINPNTSLELVELYVENVTGMGSEDYILYPSRGKGLVLVQFHRPISKEELQRMYAKISARQLDRATIHPEQIEQTSSILVENLKPSISEDVLTLYFENRRRGGGEVKEVCMLADGIAKITFLDFEVVESILKKPHKLDECNLKIQPYFDFLGMEASPRSLSPLNGIEEVNDNNLEHLLTGSLSQEEISPPIALDTAASEIHPASLEKGAVGGGRDKQISGAIEASEKNNLHSAPSTVSSASISLPDPQKLSLYKSSQLFQNLQKSHPNFDIRITGRTIEISGPSQLGVEQLKSQILESFSEIAQAHLTFNEGKARFLDREEVKDRLLQSLKQQGLPSNYTVTDCVVTVTSSSLNSVNEACRCIKSLISEFDIEVTPEFECMLYCKQWSEFLDTLGFCSVSNRRDKIEVMTLAGMEDEKKVKIIEFLSTPIQVETVITMEPGMLKYIQIHCHQLLADMDSVSIFPLEAEDVTGFKVCLFSFQSNYYCLCMYNGKTISGSHT